MRTIRILSLDGGGIRGIFSNKFMALFCEQAGIRGDELWKHFDIITGTSIGGITALAYSFGVSPDRMLNLLVSNGPRIFYIRSSLNPAGGIGPAGKATFGLALITPGTEPYIYENAALADALISVLGTTKMFQLKTNVLVTSVMFNGGTVGTTPSTSNINFPYGSDSTAVNYAIPQMFSNVILPFTTGQNYGCVEVGLATSAAPVFFAPSQIAENTTLGSYYLDGGLYQNNPTLLAYTMATAMYPGKNRICILSVGTGLPSLDSDMPATIADIKLQPANSIGLFANVLAMTIDGGQEAVHQQFQTMSLYGGVQNNLYYYRFQTRYPAGVDAELDNVQPEFMNFLQTKAQEQYIIDQLKISAFIENTRFN